MEHRHVAAWISRNLAVVCLIVTVFGGTFLGFWLFQTANDTQALSKENKQRIHDIAVNQVRIQASRLFSCRQTYEGIRLLIQPFNPHPPTSASRKFLARIRFLKAQCVEQTQPRKAAP